MKNNGKGHPATGDEKNVIPDLRGLTLREVLAKMGRPPSMVDGSGVVVGQFPLTGESYTAEGGYTVRIVVMKLSRETYTL